MWAESCLFDNTSRAELYLPILSLHLTPFIYVAKKIRSDHQARQQTERSWAFRKRGERILQRSPYERKRVGMLMLSVVEEALGPLKPAFEADGARLEVGSVEGNTVTINVLVNPNTCRECVLPAPQLERLFRQALQEREISCDVRVIFIET